ncbi:adenosylcobinamide-phosphate synthase CbiB [Pelagovum pacificum]|uniref:Cobalamin biosynthesis protein CobD n=1 Tax=Pelagovum pacificum TaxID=2588711 RepID=A0A5C5GIG2_9RHOB|nr:adenosylcobinamide-phosphate synthase CbiB [Pelagovum pacificum]QQA43188.1 cobalamin biosynthesis protein [Pelagovum pacificum]TNY33671.1 cobalamin biosynthesis protein [Pelagovum pacificum]
MTALLLAALLDAVAGEPRWLWSRVPHPVVIAGRLIDWLDGALNRGGFARVGGMAATLGLCGLAVTLGLLLAALPGALAEVIVGAILLAQRSLVTHVAAVAQALRLSLGDGRMSVAMIVGRDTAAMTEPDVARAAIESAAENFSDGVVAPAFWLAVGGLPGLLLYKAINTADSMIGHRTPRHERFGWAAARLDDVLNWIPARLSALLIRVAAGWPDANGLVADARRHRSPNAGWPEAAMARALSVALSGPRSYAGERIEAPFVHPNGRRDPGPQEIDRAVTILWRAWAAGLIVIVPFILF